MIAWLRRAWQWVCDRYNLVGWQPAPEWPYLEPFLASPDPAMHIQIGRGRPRQTSDAALTGRERRFHRSWTES